MEDLREKLEKCITVIVETKDGMEIKINPTTINLLNVDSDSHDNFSALIIKE